MPGDNHHENAQQEDYAENVSASLSRCLSEIGGEIGKGKRAATGATASADASATKPASAAPSSAGMAEALGSRLNQALGKADGGFLAGLLDSGPDDDPAQRDYGERYQYASVLGEGGQGKVLCFRDTVLDRDVAIKVVKPPYTPDRETLLENEARLGGMLEHPNILPTYDLCRDETGSPFFVMKKVEGVSLDELLKKAHADGSVNSSSRDRGELSRRRLLNIFLQVCHAMQYAHSRGVCHLDLKPQNVKLGPFGEVYVLDWGFASRTTDNPKMVAGTPLYIAPERFRPGKPDERCDVYSLGVMLYRILVNNLPRDVGKISFKEFRRRISDFPVVPPRQRDPGLPRDLEAIVMKALREEPLERYPTVAELAGDLERFLDVLPVAAYREGLWGRARKFARRHKAPVMAGAVMLAAALLTAGANFRARRLEAEAQAAQRQVEMEQRSRERAITQMRAAEDAKAAAEKAQAAADAAARETLRRRAAARVPMEKGMDIMDKSKAAVDKERDNAKKLQLLQPAIDFFTQARDILEDGGADSPDAAEAYYARARAYEQAREFGPASLDYRRAYSRDPSYIMAHYYLGLIYFSMSRENEQKAMDEFAAMNAIDPGNEFSEIGQAYIDAHLGRDAEALEKVERIEKQERAARGDAGGESWRNPGLYNIWLIRGRVHGNKGGAFYDPVKGIEAYSNYLLYDSGKAAPYINRGNLHLELRAAALAAGDGEAAAKSLDDALADYTRALEADPASKLALQHRGFALFKYKGDVQAGLGDIETAIGLDPKYVTAILDRAAINETLGNFDAAMRDYALVKEISPDNQNIDYRIGILHLYTNRLPEAEAAMDLALAKSPGGQSLGIRHHRRGCIRLLRGNYQGAVEDFDASLALRTSDRIYPALMRWLALARLGTPPPPAELARQIDMNPNQPWLAVVASIYLGEAPFGEDQALRLAETPEARCETGFYLGARAWARGETVNALAFLEQAVASDVKLFMEYNMAKILAGRLAERQAEARRLPDTVGAPAGQAPEAAGTTEATADGQATAPAGPAGQAEAETQMEMQMEMAD